MSHGAKEGLVASPAEWPGATAVPGLLAGMVLEGLWYDRDLETRARRRGADPDPTAFARTYTVRLTALPPWAGLSPSALRQRHETLLHDVEAEAPSRPPVSA